MHTPDYLLNQFTNLHDTFRGITDDLTDSEWLTRAALGQNLLGYAVWHMPRTQDSFVQTWIRGVAEVAHHERWSRWHALKPLGIGVGISLEEADHIAHTVQKPDVMTYADEVYETITDWLASIDESELDQVPDARQHLSAFPEYQTSGFVGEIAGLYDQPVWSVLIRPCMGHIHRHLGELEVVKAIIRASA